MKSIGKKGFFNMFMNGLMPKGLNLIVGLVVFAAGGAALAGRFGLFALPEIPLLVLEVLAAIAGLIMILDGIGGTRNM